LVQWEKSGVAWEERIRPAREVQAAALIRATHANAQLREVMTQFWHDHFNVNSMRDEHTAAFFAVYDKTMRKHALGNFRELLGEVTKSPAMLYYLNNDASRASPATENFARELLELHTLGAENYLNTTTTNWSDVPGAREGRAEGYIDQDVYEAARALTGWSVGDGRWVSEGEAAPETGTFHYIDRWHDPYQKRILGAEYRANQGPKTDGEQLLDSLASHPATAKFICTKICRRLVADDPPVELVQHATTVWLANTKSPDQIAKTIRAIVLSPEFAAAPASKLKRPFEFLVSLYRAAGAEVTSPSLSYLWNLTRAGWQQHEFRPPTGHPDVAEHWANTATLSAYVDMALNACEEWSEAGRINFANVGQGTSTVVEMAKQFSTAIVGSENAALPEVQNEREWIIKGLMAATALTPQFLYR
jgi:uncharacterized protein (DUF1800 family)